MGMGSLTVVTMPLDAALRLFDAFGVDLLGSARSVANTFIGLFEGMANGVISAFNEIIRGYEEFIDRVSGTGLLRTIAGFAGIDLPKPSDLLGIGTIDSIKLGRLYASTLAPLDTRSGIGEFGIGGRFGEGPFSQRGPPWNWPGSLSLV